MKHARWLTLRTPWLFLSDGMGEKLNTTMQRAKLGGSNASCCGVQRLLLHFGVYYGSRRFQRHLPVGTKRAWRCVRQHLWDLVKVFYCAVLFLIVCLSLIFPICKHHELKHGDIRPWGAHTDSPRDNSLVFSLTFSLTGWRFLSRGVGPWIIFVLFWVFLRRICDLIWICLISCGILAHRGGWTLCGDLRLL